MISCWANKSGHYHSRFEFCKLTLAELDVTFMCVASQACRTDRTQNVTALGLISKLGCLFPQLFIIFNFNKVSIKGLRESHAYVGVRASVKTDLAVWLADL